ncbi:hypothetical protein LP419_35015 [Massilia sp. H-1]|nr:hypothetical protein LP419_35015 [Massilia sp. H-1]
MQRCWWCPRTGAPGAARWPRTKMPTGLKQHDVAARGLDQADRAEQQGGQQHRIARGGRCCCHALRGNPGSDSAACPRSVSRRSSGPV